MLNGVVLWGLREEEGRVSRGDHALSVALRNQLQSLSVSFF